MERTNGRIGVGECEGQNMLTELKDHDKSYNIYLCVAHKQHTTGSYAGSDLHRKTSTDPYFCHLQTSSPIPNVI